MKCKYCDKKIVSKVKGLCHFHYYRQKRGIPPDWPFGKIYNKKTKQVCKAKGCDQWYSAKGYCRFHYERNRHGVPLDRAKGVKGKLNCNWKGGISYYPNQYQMKKNKKIKLEQENGKCEICKRKAKEVHHIKERANHSIENLKLLCTKCHRRLHRGRKNKTSIWIRRYGMNIQELCKILRCSYYTLVKWHKSGDIAFFLGK